MGWAPDYTTPELLKDWLEIDDDDDADDDFIALWITTASRNVDDFCGRQFGITDAVEERTYLAATYDDDERAWAAAVDDVFDVDDLVVENGAGSSVDFEPWPRNAPQKGKPYERILVGSRGRLTFGGVRWGWPEVPAAASMGMLLQAARLEARRGSPFGIAGSPSEGSEQRLLAQLDPDFRTSLRPYRRKWWAA